MLLKDFLGRWFNPKPQRKITVSKIDGSNYIDAQINSERGKKLTEVIDLIKINKVEEVKSKLTEFLPLGYPIIILDDFIITGKTMKSIWKVIKDNGRSEVGCLCVSGNVKDKDLPFKPDYLIAGSYQP
jgi:pyrimidine operon attenuation protein/uracil phosphoribosyltransferase